MAPRAQAAVRLVEDATIRQSSEARVGKVIADTYRIDRLIAQGGMGSVYECEHVRLQQRFAVKFLETKAVHDDEAYARFRQEAEIAASLNHRSIVQVFDFNSDEDGDAYMLMELVEGETLAAYMAGRELPIRDVIALLEPIASGLDAAHRAGIVHRDLKPSNIMVRPKRKGGFDAKLLDFGISKMRDAQVGMTAANVVMGSPRYMSPEQAKGRTNEVDARTDIFALGAILYEMITGKRAFEGRETPKLLHAIVYEHPKSIVAARKECPSALARVVLRCLCKDPKERYASVRALIAAVREAMKEDRAAVAAATKPEPAAAQPPAPRRVGAKLAWASLWLASLAVAGGVASFVTWHGEPPPRELPPPETIPAKTSVNAAGESREGFDASVATIGARMLSVGGSLYRADGRGLTFWADLDAPPKFRPLPSPAPVTAMGRTRGGEVLVGQADGTVTRWDRILEAPTWQRQLRTGAIAALSGDGDYLAVASRRHVELYNTRTARLLKRFDGEEDVVAVALTGGPRRTLMVVRPHTVDVVDADARRAVGSVPLVDVALAASLSEGQRDGPPRLVIDFQHGDWIVRRACHLTFSRGGNEPRLELGPGLRL